MFKKSLLFASLMIGSLGMSIALKAQNPPPQHEANYNDRRSMFLFDLAIATMAAYSNNNGGFSDAFSLFSREMNALLLTELLSKTSLRDYTLPLVITALHGRQIIKFSVGTLKGAMAFRAAYKKHKGTTNGWMQLYAKRLIPSLIKHQVVNLGMKGIAKGAEKVGIRYPETIRNNFWLMHFARQIPLFVHDCVSSLYDTVLHSVYA